MEIETKQSRVVFSRDLNNNNTLFGGTAVKWMDEVGYIAATRFTRKKMVTISINNVRFLHPIKTGVIVDIVAQIINVENVKMEILVEIFAEDMYFEHRQRAVEAIFTFACVNDDNNAVRLK